MRWNPFGRRRPAQRQGAPLSLDEWVEYFKFGANWYQTMGMSQTLGGNTEAIGSGFAGMVHGGFKGNGVVFACEMVRVRHFSEATFKFRRQRDGRPGDLFGTEALARLEDPWPGGTTGDLLTRMLLHADFGGNAFVARSGLGVTCLRPDWVTIIGGSPRDVGNWDPDTRVIGYLYVPGGPGSGNDPIRYLPEEVAHFAPVADPLAVWSGMPWLLPVVRDVEGDQAATEHKKNFFEKGATPNMIVGLEMTDAELFKEWVEVFRNTYEGADNAYKTMFLGAGAKADVVGANFQQIDFKSTTGAGETRIAAAAGVPPVIVGLSEGLQGSSLNAGNYSAARRQFADGTMAHLWRNAAGSLERIVEVPGGSQLWYDARDIPFLREDVGDQATILAAQATAIRTLVDGGFDPDAAVDAVVSNDLSLLAHTGLVPVQLNPPGESLPSTNGSASTVPATE